MARQAASSQLFRFAAVSALCFGIVVGVHELEPLRGIHSQTQQVLHRSLLMHGRRLGVHCCMLLVQRGRAAADLRYIICPLRWHCSGCASSEAALGHPQPNPTGAAQISAHAWQFSQILWYQNVI